MRRFAPSYKSFFFLVIILSCFNVFKGTAQTNDGIRHNISVRVDSALINDHLNTIYVWCVFTNYADAILKFQPGNSCLIEDHNPNIIGPPAYRNLTHPGPFEDSFKITYTPEDLVLWPDSTVRCQLIFSTGSAYNDINGKTHSVYPDMRKTTKLRFGFYDQPLFYISVTHTPQSASK